MVDTSFNVISCRRSSVRDAVRDYLITLFSRETFISHICFVTVHDAGQSQLIFVCRIFLIVFSRKIHVAVTLIIWTAFQIEFRRNYTVFYKIKLLRWLTLNEESTECSLKS